MRSEFQSGEYEKDIFIEDEEPILDVVNKKDYFLMFYEKSPESNINTRPVYRGAADENDAYTTILIAKQTEKERIGLTEELRMLLNIGDGYSLNIDFSIQSSMVDMKYRRAMRGYKKGNPSFGCFLCTKSSKEWRDVTNIKSGFKIDRTYAQQKQLAEYYRINPDGISKDKLEKIAKGYEFRGVVSGEEEDCLIDSLHLLLSMSRFISAILLRLNARLTQWNIESDIKHLVIPHEIKFKQDLLQLLGINMKFALEGNAARTIFQEHNEEKTLELLTADDPKDDIITPTQIDGHDNEGHGPLSRKEIFRKILRYLRFQIAVVSCKYPKKEFNIEEFKQKEIDLNFFYSNIVHGCNGHLTSTY